MQKKIVLLTNTMGSIIRFLRNCTRPDDLSVCLERKERFLAPGREIIRDWVLDNFQQFDWGVASSNRKLLQQVNHQTTKTIERSRYTSLIFDFKKFFANENLRKFAIIRIKVLMIVLR